MTSDGAPGIITVTRTLLFARKYMSSNLRVPQPKRRVKAKLRDNPRRRTQPNETWAMDFVHDQLATGTKLRVLTIVDSFSRFSPALEPRLSFRGTDVVEVLERVGREVGLPATSFGSTRALSSCRAT